jgi:hypothetical protein
MTDARERRVVFVEVADAYEAGRPAIPISSSPMRSTMPRSTARP